MNKRILNTFAVLIFALISINSSAQIDSVFWFAAPWVTPSHAGNTPVVLRISTFNTPTTVRVQQPAGSYDSTFVVPANTLNSHFLTSIISTLESSPANTPLNYGLKITADTLITVVYEVVTNGNNPETYSLKGQNGLGTEFVAPFQTIWNNGSYTPIQPKSMICIVATENNTTVWITPKSTVVGHAANTTYSVTLQAGQTYTIENTSQATSTAGNNLSGTIIVSDKPIAVTVSDDSVASSGGGCRDLMGDQIVPTDVIGTEYIVNKGNMNAAALEGIFIVGTENFTQVTVTNLSGTTTHLMNQGDTWYFNITEQLNYVVADKPVYVLQASGFGCELGEALLPPINCAGSNQVSFTRTNNQTFIINLLCPTSGINNFTLNGSTTLVPGTAFSAVPGTGGAWSGAQITFSTADIPSGTSNLLSNSSDFFGLGVINGGSTSGCYYHYMSSFIRKVNTKAGNDTTLCSGENAVPLHGSITGGATTGIWTVLNGTGNFSSATSLNSVYYPSNSDYAQGQLTFILKSTGNCSPVTDTMIVSFIQSPVVNAGADQSFCKNNTGIINLSGSVQFASAASWSGGNGGAFSNSGSLNASYTPSPADIIQDSLIIKLTSAGSYFACPSDVDTLIIYFTNPPNVQAGADQIVCSGHLQATLNGSVSGSGTTGIWSTSGSGAFSPSQSNLTSDYLLSSADSLNGSVYLTLTSTNNGNCLAVQDSIEISVINQPVVNINVTDSVCADLDNLSLNGSVTAGFSSIWSTSGFGTIANTSNLSTIYTVSQVDTVNGYIYLYLSSSGFCPSVTDSLRINFIHPPQAFAGTDQAFCENAAIQLNGTISGPNPTGTWSTLGTGNFYPGVNFLTTLYFPSTGDVGNGSVSLLLSSAGLYGCPTAYDTLNITFKKTPTAAFSFNNVCEGVNMPFTDGSSFIGGSITNWNWDFSDSLNSIAQNPLHTYNADGNYPVTLIVTSSNGCTDTLTQTVTVFPEPAVSFENTLACDNGIIQFTDQSFVSSGNLADWNYSFAGYGTSNLQNPEFAFTQAGIYPVTLTVTSTLGCSASATQNVNVIAGPSAAMNINPNPAIALEQITFTDISTGSNLVNWYWNFGDGEGDNDQVTQHSYDAGGVYLVTLIVTDATGCSDTVSSYIPIALLPVLPTGFSPNGDGQNDTFIIRGGPFKSVDFKIYNNWGQLIFESNDQNLGWDGTYKGEDCPLGVYTWTFNVEMSSGQLIKNSGDVTLIR